MAGKASYESEGKFRLFFEDNPQPMWIFDCETLKFLEVNRSAVARYGYTLDEFLNMRVTDIGSAEAGRLESTDTEAVIQCRHRLKDGRFIDVEIARHRVVYAGRNSVLAVVLDITQRKVLEERLRQAQKMEAVGMLAGGIAHDFNNLLTIITGYSEMLVKALEESDPNNRQAAEQILKAGERAATLTRQLLAFSRHQVLQPKVLDLNSLVAGMETMLRRLIGEDIDLRIDLGAELGRIIADPGQIEQVVLNLAVNARHAIPQGGTLTIETSNAKLKLEEAYTGSRFAVPGACVLLSVTDSGFGMDADTREHAFEPFFTTKPQGQGTGLGLSTVFGIVKQSGGNVELYSEPGKGCCVKVYLPRIDEPEAEETKKPQVSGPQGSETILVVEDDEAVRLLVSQALERTGYNVLSAAKAADALHIVSIYPGPIHLLVTDIVMPRMSGIELAARLRTTRPKTKVLYISGYTNPAVDNNFLLPEYAPFLHKPFASAALTHKVREILDSGSEQYREISG